MGRGEGGYNVAKGREKKGYNRLFWCVCMYQLLSIVVWSYTVCDVPMAMQREGGSEKGFEGGCE